MATQITSHVSLAEGLEVLGGQIPLDGRVSWVPSTATGWQPSNCYLLTDGYAALLVDTGLALHEQLILDELSALIGAGSSLSMFFTRGEMDCVSNLGAIALRFDVEKLFTGGATNPFDAMDDVYSMRFRDRREQIDKKGPGGESMPRTPLIEIGPHRSLAIDSPLLRLLPTFWGWDAATGALFTSDTFTHGVATQIDDPRVIDSTTTDESSVASVRAHLLAKYEWLAYANTKPIREWLAVKFAELQPEIIAPTRGCVLRGRRVVDRHLELMLAALDFGSPGMDAARR